MSSVLYSDTITLLQSLENFIQDIENKLILEDTFIIDNLTILTNSSIVLTCTYLESYIRDAFNQSIDKLNMKLSEQQLPDNIVRWTISNGDEKKLNLERDSSKIFKIDDSYDHYRKFVDKISGNVSLTLKVFQILGINLKNIPRFEERKEEIGNFIDTRNQVVYRNVQHSTTLGDLRNKIEVIKDYLAIIANY